MIKRTLGGENSKKKESSRVSKKQGNKGPQALNFAAARQLLVHQKEGTKEKSLTKIG